MSEETTPATPCDLSTITTKAALETLIRAAYDRIGEIDLDHANAEVARKRRIAAVVGEINGLIGTHDQPPFNPDAHRADPSNPMLKPTIRSLVQHPPEVLAQFSGLTLSLMLGGMEVLARASRDLGLVVGEE